MFFHVSRQQQENFPCQWHLGGFFIGTDAGWQQRTVGRFSLVYKGYLDSGVLESALETIAQQTEPKLTGNFCAIVYDHNTTKLHLQSDRYRSFPIYIGDGYITNLISTGRTAWADSLITIDNNGNIHEDKVDVIGTISTTFSTIDQIDNLLTVKIQQFAQSNTLPIRVFLSGGVDTLLVYSYIKRLKIPHELVWNSHCDFDKFYLANHSDIQAHWGYTQIHHWQDSCVLASGAPGDEFMLRSPTTSNMYLLHNGTDILKELSKNNSVLHREYFLQSKHTKLFAQQIDDFLPTQSTEKLYWTLCNIVVNDWQHWHLGNTLTWTPLRDIELFKLFLQLPFDLAKAQIMDSTVSQQLIEKNVPGLTATISDQKNTKNYMKNLQKLL
jgi:hypothetical protein